MSIQKQKFFKIDANQRIDYKNMDLLKFFLTDQGKILPRRATGITIQQQKKVAKAIKRARILSLLPFIEQNSM